MGLASRAVRHKVKGDALIEGRKMCKCRCASNERCGLAYFYTSDSNGGIAGMFHHQCAHKVIPEMLIATLKEETTLRPKNRGFMVMTLIMEGRDDFQCKLLIKIPTVQGNKTKLDTIDISGKQRHTTASLATIEIESMSANIDFVAVDLKKHLPLKFPDEVGNRADDSGLLRCATRWRKMWLHNTVRSCKGKYQIPNYMIATRSSPQDGEPSEVERAAIVVYGDILENQKMQSIDLLRKDMTLSVRSVPGKGYTRDTPTRFTTHRSGGLALHHAQCEGLTYNENWICLACERRPMTIDAEVGARKREAFGNSSQKQREKVAYDKGFVDATRICELGCGLNREAL